MSSVIARHIMDIVQHQEQERLLRLRRAVDAYYTKLPPTLMRKPGQADDNLKLGLIRLLVDKSAQFLFNKNFSFEIDMVENTNEEIYLKRVWKRNRKFYTLHSMAVNGALSGHVFVRLIQPTSGRKVPRILVLDPLNVNVRWNPNDLDELEFVHHTYPAIDRFGKPITHRQRFERIDTDQWIIIEETSHPDAENRRWEEASRYAWPWSFPPVYHCQNLPAPNEFWGIADVEDDLIDLLQAMNFTLGTIRKIIRYHGSPKTIASGVNRQQLKVDTDETIILPNPDARIYNLEMASDLGAAMSFYNTLRETLYAEARVPEIALGNLASVGALSGVALKIVYQPILDKTEVKQSLYGEMLEAINAALLVMGGYRDNIDEVEVRNVWPELLPVDEMIERQMLQIDKEFGVSLTTILGKLGYDYATEQEKRSKEGSTDEEPARTNIPTDQSTLQEPAEGQESQDDTQTQGGLN